MSQFFGDRALIANATGCSSIYGGNLPTTPWSTNADGRGPSWNNSLFEDNAEFGLGLRLAVDQKREYAEYLLRELSTVVGDELVKSLLEAPQTDEAEIGQQRERVAAAPAAPRRLGRSIGEQAGCNCRRVRQSQRLDCRRRWLGLRHRVRRTRPRPDHGPNVNILVLDTGVYSNTGGQASKATPRAAVAKFAAGGKPSRKKDLGMLAVAYGNVYVAQIAMGSNPAQTVRALREADSYQARR